MRVLAGIASRGDGASRRLGHACEVLASQADVRRLSRPWWTPSADGGPSGLVAAALVDVDLGPQDVRAWLWDLEDDAGAGVQTELLAGQSQRGWRWGVDAAGRDGAWLGPLADIVPDLALRGGRTLIDQLSVAPDPGRFPWMDAGKGRFMERPAGFDALRVGRTWEARGRPVLP